MQTRYMERSNSMGGGGGGGGGGGREKRPLDSNSTAADEDGQPDRKRPALASVIVEALKVDSLQRLCSSLEPILRRVVSEEVERALAKLGPARLVGNGRTSPKRIEAPDGRNLQLHFRSRLSLPLFTGGKVEGEQGAAIHIVLIDANSGQLVTTGPESSAKLDIVVLEGDFNDEDDADWTQEDFESHLVKEREGKRPLLTGDLQVTLKEGVGTLGELTFTDNSSWIRSRQFRLGLKVAVGNDEGVRIREAKTEAFTVKDHRGELYKKHYPPALNDEVWRLEKIGKDGAFHKRLNKAGVVSVEDFLRFVVRDPQRLRNILGSGMSNKMWDALVEHAKTCVLSGKVFIYYPDGPQGVGVIFNSIYEFIGLFAVGQYYSTDSLSDTQKVYADSLIKKAYENWMHVVEYDGKSLLSLKQSTIEDSSRTEASVSQPNPSFYNHQLSLPSLPVAPPVEQPSVDPGLKMGGLHDSMGTRYSAQSQTMNLNGSAHFDATSFLPPNQFMGSSGPSQPRNNNALSLVSAQPSFSGMQSVGTTNFADYRGSENLLSEDEIRMRSNQMLEHEDMQHLLLLFGMGGSHQAQTPIVAEEAYPYPAGYAPSPAINFNFDEDRGRSSGKAVVGWLKLKAALRWGIFVRKKAAERRAQLVELDDT